MRLNPETAHAEQKYRGDVAATYDAKRAASPKWQAENRIIAQMLNDYPPGTQILDCPIGTGRFIPLYEAHRFHVLGLDINSDMLAEASKKITTDLVTLREGNIVAIDRPAKSVDVAIAIRLLNWLAPEDVYRALRELQRIARRAVVFNVRVADHPRARPMRLINAAVDHDGKWVMADIQGIEDEFLMFKLARS